MTHKLARANLQAVDDEKMKLSGIEAPNTPMSGKSGTVGQDIIAIFDRSPVARIPSNDSLRGDGSPWSKADAIEAAERGELSTNGHDVTAEVQGLFTPKKDPKARLSKPASLDGALASFDTPSRLENRASSLMTPRTATDGLLAQIPSAVELPAPVPDNPFMKGCRFGQRKQRSMHAAESRHIPGPLTLNLDHSSRFHGSSQDDESTPTDSSPSGIPSSETLPQELSTLLRPQHQKSESVVVPHTSYGSRLQHQRAESVRPSNKVYGARPGHQPVIRPIISYSTISTNLSPEELAAGPVPGALNASISLDHLRSAPISSDLSPEELAAGPVPSALNASISLDHLRPAPISKEPVYDGHLHPAQRTNTYFNPADNVDDGVLLLRQRIYEKTGRDCGLGPMPGESAEIAAKQSTKAFMKKKLEDAKGSIKRLVGRTVGGYTNIP